MLHYEATCYRVQDVTFRRFRRRHQQLLSCWPCPCARHCTGRGQRDVNITSILVVADKAACDDERINCRRTVCNADCVPLTELVLVAAPQLQTKIIHALLLRVSDGTFRCSEVVPLTIAGLCCSRRPSSRWPRANQVLAPTDAAATLQTIGRNHPLVRVGGGTRCIVPSGRKPAMDCTVCCTPWKALGAPVMECLRWSGKCPPSTSDVRMEWSASNRRTPRSSSADALTRHHRTAVLELTIVHVHQTPKRRGATTAGLHTAAATTMARTADAAC